MQQHQREMNAYPLISKRAFARDVGLESELMPILFAGIANHFRLRAHSWIMAGIMLGMSWSMFDNPRLFTSDIHSYAYVYLLRVAPQYSWAWYCLLIGATRFVSLVVNGSYPSFPYAAHIRAMGSFLACFVWFQLLLSAVTLQDVSIGIPMFSGLLAFDIFSTYVAAHEIR